MLRGFVIDIENSQADFFGHFSANGIFQRLAYLFIYLFSIKEEKNEYWISQRLKVSRF